LHFNAEDLPSEVRRKIQLRVVHASRSEARRAINSKSVFSFQPMLVFSLLMASLNSYSLRATVLFQDDFLTGWTVVQPQGEYFAGPLRWEYDLIILAFFVMVFNGHVPNSGKSLLAVLRHVQNGPGKPVPVNPSAALH
jgi:hypothetical protein